MIAATIIQLVLIYRTAKTSEPFLSWEVTLSTEIVQCLGIIASCIPYLKPFLESLESGMMSNDDLRRRTISGDARSDLNSSKSRGFFSKPVIEGFVYVTPSVVQLSEPGEISSLSLNYLHDHINNARARIGSGKEGKSTASLPSRPQYTPPGLLHGL